MWTKPNQIDTTSFGSNPIDQPKQNLGYKGEHQKRNFDSKTGLASVALHAPALVALGGNTFSSKVVQPPPAGLSALL